jgi:hypothetical protein
MSDTIYKRTPIIEFQRQLRPQPPKDSEPFFCYVNTLIFYERGTHKEIWREKIPEVDLVGMQTQDFNNNSLENRHYQWGTSVQYEEKWGWVLKFKISHEHAETIWKVLFPQVTFDRELFVKPKKD